MANKWMAGVLTAALLMANLPNASAAPPNHDDRGDDRGRIKRVLLISIDGMHAVEYENCANEQYPPRFGRARPKTA